MISSASITLLYDKECSSGYKGGWGLSLWIKLEPTKKVILFDTGWNGEILLHNISKSGKNIDEISYIFLSHNHWDHVSGVIYLLNQNLKNLESIIVPKSFSTNLKKELSVLVQINEISPSKSPIEIFPKAWTTGEMGTDPQEHSLLLKLKSGRVLIITGCSHPQVEKIIAKAVDVGPVFGIAGGFHDFSNLESLDLIDLIVPMHCTKLKKEILDKYPEKAKSLKVGESLTINDDLFS